MDEKRKDAQKMELSAQAEGSGDSLQLNPSDLSADFAVSKGKSKSKPKKQHKPKSTQKALDHNIFNALVAPPSTRTTAPEDRVALETKAAMENTLAAADALKLNLQSPVVESRVEETPQPILDQFAQVDSPPPVEAVIEASKTETDAAETIIAESIPEMIAAQELLDEPLMTDADLIIDRIAAEVFDDVDYDDDPAPLILKLPLPEEPVPDYDDWEPLPPEMEMRIVPQETATDHELIIEEPIESRLDEIVVEDVATAGTIEVAAIEESPVVRSVVTEPVVEAVVDEVPQTFYDPAAVIPDEPEVIGSVDATLSDEEIAEPAAPLLNFSDQPIVNTHHVILSPAKNPADDQQDPSLAFRMTNQKSPVVESMDDSDDSESEVDELKASEQILVELKPAAESDEVESISSRTGAWWSIPMLCLGIAIAACAILVPMADENRRVSHELAQIDQDVTFFQKQSDVNKEFLERVSSDPTLAERLALRQLRLTRADSRLANIPQRPSTFGMSPFQLVAVEPPVKLPEYQPMGGFLSKYFLSTKTQIYLAGMGVLIAAAGVILGGGNEKKSPAAQFTSKSEEDFDTELSTSQV